MTNKFPWVPVYDDDLGCICLPQESGMYVVTTHSEGESPRVEVLEFEKETAHWKVDGGFDFDALDGPVIAWAIAPEPYEGAK